MLHELNHKTRIFRRVLIGVLVIAAFFTGSLCSDGNGDSEDHHGHGTESATLWTCSMHPQIRQPNPGDCPICGMDLIPLQNAEEEEPGVPVRLTERAKKLADIQVMPVERKFVTADVRMVGKIEYDETRIEYISARFPGRIERMFVNYTGTPVRKGDHLVEVYSPELYATHQELIQASLTAAPGSNALEAIRNRLRLWGLKDEQITAMAASGRPQERITVYAPVDGIVVEKSGITGQYLATGNPIYTIADLSTVWLKLDAYESDLSWLRYGQTVNFSVEALPGKTFSGMIAFIDPVLNERTRTVRVRVNVNNPDLSLKPGMFARAEVHAVIAGAGKVMDARLAGKWVCPMHPEVIATHAGKCTVCDMPLVRAETLGYMRAGSGQEEASLVVPVSAPLITGKRALVYVQSGDGEYNGREIVLGPRAGQHYIVTSGLDEGEMVVVNGAFKIDSEVQIQAGPSMMNIK